MAGADRGSKVPQWPSPWPYDFPVEGTATSSAEKVERLAIRDSKAPLTMTRRSLLGPAAAGWMAFAGAGGIGALATVRFLFPNVSFEPPQEFETKEASAFSEGQVDESWKESNAVWMVRTEGKLMAISTVCTHLGCTPNWLAGVKKFKCPCHGSGYDINGVNFEGPSPRPLERFRVSINPVTQKVVVDKNSKCRVELGTCDASSYYIDMA